MSADALAVLVPVAGGLASPLVPERARRWFLLAIAVATFAALARLEPGARLALELFGVTLVPVRVDRLGLLFGYVFWIAAFLNLIFAWHVRRGVEQPAAMVYAGAAIGAVLAGALLTLFVYWEITAIASVLLVWARGTPRAWRSGMRYVLVQLASGMLLAAGAAVRYAQTGSLDFDRIGLDGAGGAAVLLAVRG